jgi:hypothetical protein
LEQWLIEEAVMTRYYDERTEAVEHEQARKGALDEAWRRLREKGGAR